MSRCVSTARTLGAHHGGMPIGKRRRHADVVSAAIDMSNAAAKAAMVG
jgi:hypothetical protein